MKKSCRLLSVRNGKVWCACRGWCVMIINCAQSRQRQIARAAWLRDHMQRVTAC